MKIFIKTYGCQANLNDSEIIAGILEKEKFEIVDSEKKAEAIIINSCSVKNKTQSKIFHYIEKNKDKKIFVGGCLSRTIDIKKRYPFVLGVFDTNSIKEIKKIIEKNKDKFSDEKTEKIILPVKRKNKKTAIIQISEGCLNDCTFCATKFSRGNLKSYSIEKIKKSFEKSVKEGCNLIYLTSQDNGCYGFDIKTNLPELLNSLLEVEGNYKIRIGMMNPWHAVKILPELLKIYESDKIIKFVHLPIQSGSNKVLKDMKRLHGVKEFVKIIKEFRKKFSDISIATDIIVGYPTETEKDFEETIKLTEKVKPEVLNIATFSSRPKTKASKLKQLSSEIIKSRTKKINDIYWDYRKDLKRVIQKV